MINDDGIVAMKKIIDLGYPTAITMDDETIDSASAN